MASEPAPGDFEAEYNVRLLHPDHARYHERCEARSRVAYREFPVTREIRYGPGPRALLDFFPATRAAAGTAVPLVAYFHGGYWRAHERSQYAFIARAFAPAGIATALVGYDLAPQASLAQIVAQARGACAWLRENAGSLGFDARLLFTAGHSAGAHLAACALTAGETFGGAILVSGIYDLAPLVHTTLNGQIGLTSASARRWSPVRHALPSGASALIAVGAFETTEFLRQSNAFARAWRSAGSTAEVMTVPAAHHYSIVLELDNPDSALSRDARHLVQRVSSRTLGGRRRRPAASAGT